MSTTTAADREAILALVGAYAERLDAGDLDGVAELFDGGAFRSGPDGRVRHGRDDVRRMYDPVLLYEDGTPRTKHVLGNIDVTVDGDVATARCLFTVFQCAPGQALHAVLSGRYHDRFTKAEGQWRFEERVVHADLLGDLSRHMSTRRS